MMNNEIFVKCQDQQGRVYWRRDVEDILHLPSKATRPDEINGIWQGGVKVRDARHPRGDDAPGETTVRDARHPRGRATGGVVEIDRRNRDTRVLNTGSASQAKTTMRDARGHALG